MFVIWDIKIQYHTIIQVLLWRCLMKPTLQQVTVAWNQIHSVQLCWWTYHWYFVCMLCTRVITAGLRMLPDTQVSGLKTKNTDKGRSYIQMAPSMKVLYQKLFSLFLYFCHKPKSILGHQEHKSGLKCGGRCPVTVAKGWQCPDPSAAECGRRCQKEIKLKICQ